MNKKILISCITCLVVFAFCLSAGCIANGPVSGDETITIIDDLGREVVIPADVKTVAMAGLGSSRYTVYLQAEDMIIGVDSTDNSTIPNTRPYMLAHPEIAKMPLLGANKVAITAELALQINPDVIIYSVNGPEGSAAADEATERTGIPVVCFYQYDPADDFDKFAFNMRLLGTVLGKEQRAEEVLTFFRDMRADLIKRTPDMEMSEKPVVYLGGASFRGAHGMTSTREAFIGFTLLSANQKLSGTGVSVTTLAKEKILEWDPDMIFIDLATREAAGGGALYELKTDPSYQGLSAVINGEIYAVLPDSTCKANHGTSFANAYYVGTVLYPEQFKDIDPEKKANEIFTFLVGKPVFDQMFANSGSLAYQKVDLSTI